MGKLTKERIDAIVHAIVTNVKDDWKEFSKDMLSIKDWKDIDVQTLSSLIVLDAFKRAASEFGIKFMQTYIKLMKHIDELNVVEMVIDKAKEKWSKEEGKDRCCFNLMNPNEISYMLAREAVLIINDLNTNGRVEKFVIEKDDVMEKRIKSINESYKNLSKEMGTFISTYIGDEDGK